MTAKNIIENIVGSIFVVYISFIATKSFCNTTPSYCATAWTIFACVVVGIGAYLRYAEWD